MDKIRKQLKSHSLPVTQSDWDKLEQKLKESKTIPLSKNKGFINKWMAVAATLLLLVSAYFIFQWPMEYNTEVVSNTDQLEEVEQHFLEAEKKGILSHRKNPEGLSELVSSPNKGHGHYLANLPNGEQWFIQLSLIRETGECKASIHSINDKPFAINMRAEDTECLEFISERKNASLQLVEIGDSPTLLLVLNQSKNGFQDELALELRPVY